MMEPRLTPCGSCPYRRDCPSGVWAASEYNKLPEYDAETFAQPHTVFMCHSDNVAAKDSTTICRGWLDTHSKEHSLALRLSASAGLVPIDIFDLPPSGVPVFASGAEAAAHGKRDLKNVSEEAATVIDKLKAARRKRSRKKRKP